MAPWYMRPNDHGEVSGMRDSDGESGTGVWDERAADDGRGVGHGVAADERAAEKGA
jgi:hypothetical protein